MNHCGPGHRPLASARATELMIRGGPGCRATALHPGYSGLIGVVRCFATLLADDRFLAGVLDRHQDGADVGFVGVEVEPPGERRFRQQFASFEQGPHFFAVMQLLKIRREEGQCRTQFVDVAQQHCARMVVAGGADRLRQVDDDRAVGVDQHVVFGQVAVDHAFAEHAYDLAHQEDEIFACLLRIELHFAQPRRAVAFGVVTCPR